MKKVVRACLALMLGILMTVNVYADSGMAQYPDYVTDYYMVVESPDGGIDFYAGASFDSSKLNEELIPNGTAFRIEGEVTDANKRVWGYSKYHGMTGYICEDDCRMVTRSEAIKSELGIAQTAEADYDYVAAGEKILYNGPGEKFGKVSGSIAIPEGTTVHIEKEAKLADGSDWGYTTYQYEGWIELESLVNIEEEAVEENNTEEASMQESTTDVVNLENTNESTIEADQNAAETEQESVENAVVENETVAALNEENGDAKEQKAVQVTSTPTPEPTATSTPTPKPTATNTPIPEPTATSTPTPEPTATSTPTPEPTATSTPTPEPTSTNTPTPEATATSTPTAEPTEEAEKTTAEPTVTQAVQQEEASSSNVESAAEWYQNPMIWIGGICILLIIILLIYHFIKKNK